MKWTTDPDGAGPIAVGDTIALPSAIKDFGGGIKVGFIGAVTEDLPNLVAPSALTGVAVSPIAAAANQQALNLVVPGCRRDRAAGPRGCALDGLRHDAVRRRRLRHPPGCARAERRRGHLGSHAPRVQLQLHRAAVGDRRQADHQAPGHLGRSVRRGARPARLLVRHRDRQPGPGDEQQRGRQGPGQHALQLPGGPGRQGDRRRRRRCCGRSGRGGDRQDRRTVQAGAPRRRSHREPRWRVDARQPGRRDPAGTDARRRPDRSGTDRVHEPGWSA